MKSLLPAIALLLLALSATAGTAADSAGGPYAVSPDHPSTWASGADNIHQSLRWDARKQMLFADVKFSTVAYASDASPTEVEDFSLSFPTVRLNPQTRHFTANGVDLGSLKEGLFGAEVALNKDLELDIHRLHHGQLYASIKPAPEE
jgi:hypothetical protein